MIIDNSIMINYDNIIRNKHGYNCKIHKFYKICFIFYWKLLFYFSRL